MEVRTLALREFGHSRNRNMRFLLVDLIKGHLHSVESHNREKGFSIDISWIVDELGLKELR
jgi:hypothetical protein